MTDNQKVILSTLIVCSLILLGIVFYNKGNIFSKSVSNVNKTIDIKGYQSNEEYYNKTIDGYRISDDISDKIANNQLKFIMSALTKYNFYIDDTNNNYEGYYLYMKDYNVNSLDNNFKLYTAINSLYQSNMFTKTTKEEYDKYKAIYKVSGKLVSQTVYKLFGTNVIDKRINNWLSSLDLRYDETNDIYYLINNKSFDKLKKTRYIVTTTIDTEEKNDTYLITEAVAFVNTNTKTAYDSYYNGNVAYTLDDSEVFSFNSNNIGNFKEYRYTFKKDDNGIYHFQSIEKMK